ncbi:MAG: TonB-dependent receptor [Candidatus Symbiothrix sp.]|jgi:TonB-linked SusC/RagA family outer membrane protein|nr:TonB-dependent receptor [Candidatus Symbiothrix sp.]
MMKNYIFKKKRKLACLLMVFLTLPSFLFAQTNAVSGAVTENGAGLMGVSILEKGTTNGTVSDMDGNFKLELTKSPSVLVFSMLGMAKQEKTVSAGDNVNVALEEDAKMLSEIVVTGYTTQRKADLTGAVAVVDISDMMKSAENNPIKALQGRVAGVNISADGNPSGAATVRIRGIGTLNNNDPLYIIDGVPTKGGMHELNSNDIESMQVLKDASAASIYGSRAANGVIIITTKKGKSGQVKVNFDAYITGAYYGKSVDMLNTKQYGEALWKANLNSGIDPNSNQLGYYFNDGYNDDGSLELYGMSVPKYLDSPYGSNTMPSSDTDWFDAITKTGFLQSYNLSVSGGTDKYNSFFSLGYLDNQGTVKYTDFSRISARMNSSYKLLDDRITIGENFSVNRTHETQMPDGVLDLAKLQLPIMPVYRTDGSFSSVTPAMNDRHNPMRLLYDNKDNSYDFWRLFGNAYIDIQPVKNLHLKSTFGLDYGNYYQRVLSHSFTGWLLASDLTSSTMLQRHWQKYTWTNIATYNLSVGKNRADFLAGVEMIDNMDIDFSAERRGFEIEYPNYMYPSAGTGEQYAYGGATAYSLMSFFGKIDYAFDDKYLASVTLRRDGSSRFGKRNRWAIFPAFSAGWRISQEKFMENTQSWLSDLKLRAGWGQTGNQEIDNYANQTLMGANYIGDTGGGINNNTAYDINGNDDGDLPYGYELYQLSNDDLKWETTTQTNVGVDFAFFKNTLYGTAEWYLKQTTDILIKPPYLAALGEGGYNWVNGASMENRGWELSLGYRNKTAFGLHYDVVGNISGYKNKITKLPESVILAYGGNGTTDVILGRAINTMYGYVADGLFRTQDDVDNYVSQTGKDIGRIRYANLNDDYKIDDEDRTWLGSPHPDFAFGLNINLEYKGIDFSAFVQGLYGNMIYNDTKVFTDFWSVSEPKMNKGTRLLNAFDPVSNPNSDIPALVLQNLNDEGRASSYYVEPGSYLKLRNLQIGYSLPTSIAKTAKLEKVRFYVSGQNLVTLKSKKFTGLDPENPNLAYPISTTFTFGLNVSF